MSVATIREEVEQAVLLLLPQSLVEKGLDVHTQRKGGWRWCPCEWCATKREATAVIGSHWPRKRGLYVEDYRDAWRDEKRRAYRAKLAELKEKNNG